jgi:NAD(P)-dependent dehydrogenase (short-subunit alcohol dehydrogenase family)
MARTYVITGARAGIGAVTAALLRNAGHRVIGVSRGGDVAADLGTPGGRAAAVEAVIDLAGGRLDAVIACAAVGSPAADEASVGYFGAVDFLEALRPVLARSEAPRAVVVTSMSVMAPNDAELVTLLRAGDESSARARADVLEAHPATRGLVEPSVKRALARWMRAASVSPEWAGAGIAVNAVGPGVVLTEATLPLLATPESTAHVDAMVPMPLGYHAPPEALAHALIWLAAAENTHCAGQNLFVDGGCDVVFRGEDIWSWADERVVQYRAETVPLPDRDIRAP